MFTVEVTDQDTLQPVAANFIQTETATKAGIAVHPYGAIIMSKSSDTITPQIQIQSGTTYTAAAAITPKTAVGTAVTFNKDA